MNLPFPELATGSVEKGQWHVGFANIRALTCRFSVFHPALLYFFSPVETTILYVKNFDDVIVDRFRRSFSIKKH
ncbi:hypothetical protein TNCV_4096171 [Trichonephila clavipes]|nr:hypothetical protein TNCV_4096171 [Trichonephila clavipes]